MFGKIASRSKVCIPGLLFLFALHACGSGIDENEGSTGGDTPLSIDMRIEGEAVPGQWLKLVASSTGDAASGFQWEQTGGPAVTLQSRTTASAQFRVPPVNRDTSFGFSVTVTGANGDSHQQRVRVNVRALSWKNLDIVETDLAENLVVFRANKDNNLRVDLYRADLDGTNIVRLNGPLVPGGNIHSFSISPNGAYVAYLADEDTTGVSELFVVDSSGGDAAKASGELTAGGNVTPDFLWSPDASRIAYRADQNTDESFELFAAFNDATTAVRLSGDMTSNGDVIEENFLWSGDSRRIVYRANQFNDNTLELFVSDRNGAGNRRVSAPPAVGGGVLGNFAWSPGDRQIAYIADQQARDVFELFVVDDDGSNNTKVSGPLVSDGSVLDFAWSPNGDTLAYRAEQTVNEVVELYSVLPDGTDNTLISALPASGNVEAYAWSPDSAAIAYLADQDIDDVIELFATGPDGAANRRVSGLLAPGGSVFEFTWSPDSAYLAYRADQETAGAPELFTSTPDGAVNLKVSGTPVAGGGVRSDWQWSGDSTWLAYRADQRTNGTFELFSAMPDGSANILVSGALTSGGNVESLEGGAFEWSPDSARIVYSADQEENDKYELYVTSPDSGIAIASLSGTLTGGGDVRNFSLASRPGALLRPRNVALISVDPTAVRYADILAKLRNTGLFDSVDLIIQANGVPTLAQLMDYRAVIVHSAGFMVNGTGFGNTLADYVDAGGGVVTGTWSSFNDSRYIIGGRFQAQNYFALVPLRSSTSGSGRTLVPVIANHPIIAGLSLNGAAGRVPSNSITAGSTIVALWSDMLPLVIIKEINGVRRVDLNFYLVSADGIGGGWNTMTDGDLLMANSLLYVMGEI